MINGYLLVAVFAAISLLRAKSLFESSRLLREFRAGNNDLNLSAARLSLRYDASALVFFLSLTVVSLLDELGFGTTFSPESGVGITYLVLFALMIVSSLLMGFTAQAKRRYEGREGLDERIEYSNLFVQNFLVWLFPIILVVFVVWKFFL